MVKKYVRDSVARRARLVLDENRTDLLVRSLYFTTKYKILNLAIIILCGQDKTVNFFLRGIFYHFDPLIFHKS